MTEVTVRSAFDGGEVLVTLISVWEPGALACIPCVCPLEVIGISSWVHCSRAWSAAVT